MPYPYLRLFLLRKAIDRHYTNNKTVCDINLPLQRVPLEQSVEAHLLKAGP